jgi:hypothetical protein
MCHSMDTCITRSRSFGFFVDRARGCEDMFVSLGKWLIFKIRSRHNLNSLIPEERCVTGHSTGLPGRSYSHDKGKWANDHLKPTFRRCAVCFWYCKISEKEIWDIKSSYSALDQSKPAGHNKAPVRSWWNPRSVLTLRANSGFRTWPRGVIQSRIALFKLFVSSDLALAEPFCIYHKWGQANREFKMRLTSSAMCFTSSVEASIKRSWSPGIIWSRWLNTRCSRCSLVILSRSLMHLTNKKKHTRGWKPHLADRQALLVVAGRCSGERSPYIRHGRYVQNVCHDGQGDL